MSSFGDINRVNTNIQAMDAQLSLNRINRNLADNQLRLSTGLRINRAEDDAAGYSIATKLNARVAGLNQALANVGDAKSVLDIAEGSFDTIMDQLIEMKTLTTQAANETLGVAERNFIATQLKEIGNNINDIANQTVFQDYGLLKGNDGANTGGLTLSFQVGERASDTISTTIQAVNVFTLFNGTDEVLQLGTDVGRIYVTPDWAMGADYPGYLYFGTGSDQVEAADFRLFLGAVDGAIEYMAERVNEIGVTQSSLSIREVTLSQSISANSSAASRIMDTDFAREQSNSIRLQILQQTATSALAQANSGPQSVLGFLR
jgi:flagellin